MYEKGIITEPYFGVEILYRYYKQLMTFFINSTQKTQRKFNLTPLERCNISWKI